jgi:hypothetical protein
MGYSASPESPMSTNGNSIIRKRGGRACDACRAQKVRCIPDSEAATCLRCQHCGFTCVYSISIRRYRFENRRQREYDIAVEPRPQTSKIEKEVAQNVRVPLSEVDNPMSMASNNMDQSAIPAKNRRKLADPWAGCCIVIKRL